VTMNGSSRKKIFVAGSGVFFILVGLFLNEWLIASWFTYSGALSVKDRIAVWIFDILMVGMGVLLIVLRGRVHLTFDKKNFALFVGTVVFLFVLSEFSARVIDRLHGGDFTYNKERNEQQLTPFRMFGPSYYVEQDGIRYISSVHKELYPFEKGRNTYRIVAFGGSTTQNAVDGIHYPLVLEQLLKEEYPQRNIEVINIGNSAYATPHFIISLTLDVVSWESDLIILSENINDLLAGYFPDFQPDYANKYRHAAFVPEISAPRMLLGWSRFYWIVKSRLEALSYRLADYGGVVFRRSSYGNEPPVESQKIFRRNLQTFVEIARAYDIPVVLGTQPLETSEEYWNRHMRYKKYNGIVTYPLHSEFISHHQRFNEIIREVAREQKAYIVDNEKIFAGKSVFFIDFVHYSKKGLEQLARNYYNVIVSNKFVR